MTKRPNENLSDEYAPLIEGATRGDARALELLLMKAQDTAYRFSYTVCGGASEADDVMQDALLKTFRYVKGIRDPHAFRTWLYRTVRNACLMSRRRKTGQPEHMLSLDELMPVGESGAGVPEATDGRRSPEALAVNKALRARLARALRGLPPGYRAIVFLRDMEGLSTREVAGVLKISEPNVKTRLHRARLFLRQQLEDR